MRFKTLSILLLLTAPAFAADTLVLAGKLVHFTGGVTVILRNYEGSMAASVGAPQIFAQSFDKALADNQAVIAAADAQLAQTYAKLYPDTLLADEVGFYESPEGPAIAADHPGPFGTVLWPEPSASGLTAQQSAAITRFHADVQKRAELAGGDTPATDAIMAAETDALVKIRAAAFANYCQLRDCKAEHVTPPPQ